MWVYFIVLFLVTVAMGILHRCEVGMFKKWKPVSDEDPPHLLIAVFWPIIALFGLFWGTVWVAYKFCYLTYCFIVDLVNGDISKYNYWGRLVKWYVKKGW